MKRQMKNMKDIASFTIVQCSVGGDQTALVDDQRDLDLAFHWSGRVLLASTKHQILQEKS